MILKVRIGSNFNSFDFRQEMKKPEFAVFLILNALIKQNF